jgi:hypothetical protein
LTRFLNIWSLYRHRCRSRFRENFLERRSFGFTGNLRKSNVWDFDFRLADFRSWYLTLWGSNNRQIASWRLDNRSLALRWCEDRYFTFRKINLRDFAFRRDEVWYLTLGLRNHWDITVW